MKKIIMISLVAAAMTFGCATDRWVSRPVTEDPYAGISLEHRVEEDAVVNPQYRHPADIAPARVKAFLAGLEYEEPPAIMGKPEKQPVFQESELTRLTPGISQALAEAGPHERISFSSFNKGGGLLFAKRRNTRGVMFIDPEDSLNIAFSCINCEIQPEETLTRSGEPVQRDPLEITRTERPLVLEHDFARLHTDGSGRTYPMWAVIDMSGFSASAPGVEAEPAPIAPDPGPEKPENKEPFASDPPAVAPEAKPEPAEPGGPSPAGQKDESRWDGQKERIKREFEILKELHEENLITPEEYEYRKTRLLDQLTGGSGD